MVETPVFFDPAGRRKRLASLIVGTLVVVTFGTTMLLLVAAVFFGTDLQSLKVRHRSTTFQDPLTISARGTTALAPRLRRMLSEDVRHAAHDAKKNSEQRVVLGYYAPYESAGIESLRRHATAMTHIAAQWLHLSADGRSIDYRRDYDPSLNPKNLEVDRIARESGIRLLPMLDNYGLKDFDRKRSARLLRDPSLQRSFAKELTAFIVVHHYDGLQLDLEELDGEDSKGLVSFASVLQKSFAPHRLSLSAAVEVENDELDVAALAERCDFIVPMLYDQHSDSGTEGPIAGVEWGEAGLAKILQTVPEPKVVMGIGNFGYDWVEGKSGAESMTFQDALSTAAGYRSESPSKVLRFDPDTSNTTYAYRDDDDRLHRVWLLDAISAYDQTLDAADLGLRGAALWNLGSEDPTVWEFFNRGSLFKRIDPKRLERVSFAYEVSFKGRGEILNVQSTPMDGARQLSVADDGTIDGCTTLRYASPFVVAKRGYVPKKLALTFDDGPDRQWTPAVLDELKRLHVPGTFFDIGASVESMPDLAAREYDEGHEVGNHSFTHPDLGSVSPKRASLEINLTQMALEGATGRSSVLFRPPYNADSEPETPDQLDPVLIADRLGYITVGENVDPTDWDPLVTLPDGSTRPRTAKDIADAVVSDVERRVGGDDEGNIVLLHDAGGDRSQTVKALGMMVPRLQKLGYEFVPVSALLHKTRGGVMPPISAANRLYYGLGRWGLGAAFSVLGALTTAFMVAVYLGIARIALLTPLALLRRKGGRMTVSAEATISVIVAAYNEAAVIVRTIESVLASEVRLLEIIVVDDGSTDGTAEVTRSAFGHDSRVIVLSKANGGKASALNLGIAQAQGDLLFHIDADTILDPRAIGLLACHFDEPRVAAVAGNVQVGNRVNLLTRWQDLEYVTSQNLDRRAYARLNCITVVPGAIGMWRREAVTAVGGYRTDTLAEDMDLTWRLHRAEYRMVNEPHAYAYTEAPERFSPFFKQRFRWAYGTLQCLWKHRGALGRNGWFGRLALPIQWLFGVVFQSLAPLIDLQIVLALLKVGMTLAYPPSENSAEARAHALGDLTRFWHLYVIFLFVEAVGAAVALRLERRSLWNLLPLILQRFVYRQMMYAVMFKSLGRAVAGTAAGWGKLARTGSVRVPSR